MKHSLPGFALAWLVGLAPCLAQVPAEVTTGEPPAVATAASPALPDGALLLAKARQALGEHASIEANLRLPTIDLLGHRLVGNGTLKQRNAGGQALVRLELKIQVAGEVSSVVQVSDGRCLWIDRQTGADRTVGRVELSQVRGAGGAGQGGPAAWSSTLADPAFALAGLGGLLAGLQTNFDFTTTGESRLGDVPVYTLVGKWKSERLAKLLPNSKKALKIGDSKTIDPKMFDQLPEHVPHAVMLLMGADDLFPYVIDFQRTPPPVQGTARQPAAAQSLVTMQWYEVRINGAIDPREFVYNPGDSNVIDQTEEFAKNLRLRLVK